SAARFAQRTRIADGQASDVSSGNVVRVQRHSFTRADSGTAQHQVHGRSAALPRKRWLSAATADCACAAGRPRDGCRARRCAETDAEIVLRGFLRGSPLRTTAGIYTYPSYFHPSKGHQLLPYIHMGPLEIPTFGLLMV